MTKFARELIDIDSQASARLEGPTREAVASVAHERKPTQAEVAVEPRGEAPRGAEHRAHARGLREHVGLGGEDLLEGDQIGVDLRQDGEDAVEPHLPVETPASVDVVGGHADATAVGRRPGHSWSW